MNSNAAPSLSSHLPDEVREAINDLLKVDTDSLFNKAKEVIFMPESQLFYHQELDPECDPECDPERESTSEAFQNIFHGIVDSLSFVQNLVAKEEFFLSLYALLVYESHYRQLNNTENAARFIRTLDINDEYLHTGTFTSSGVSKNHPIKKRFKTPRTKEQDEEMLREYRRTVKKISSIEGEQKKKTKKNYAPLRTVNSSRLIVQYENEQASSRDIRQTWLNYFNAEKTGCLKFLIDLYSPYSNYQIYKSGVAAVKYLFLKKVVDLYGKISLVSTKAADGIVIDETKLPPKKIFKKSEWEDLQTLFQRLSEKDVSKKPMVVILVTDDQVKQLVSFPEENTHFAFDIAESIYTSHQPLANNILQLRGINANVITFRSLRDIHPDIQRALANLVRQNPDIFLARTTEYIELANIVYGYSLAFFPKEKDHIFNFMKQRGYQQEDSAPADYFITENPDRLLALLFIAIAYETIEKQCHGRLSFVFFNLLINFPRLNVGCVHDGIPNDLRRSFKVQGFMREIKEMNSESAITRAISFFKDHTFSVESDIKPPLIRFD